MRHLTLLSLLTCIGLLLSTTLMATTHDEKSEAFFDATFGDLTEELETAQAQQKQGIMLFFEMEECPFCQKMRDTILTQPEVHAFFKQHFLIFPIDILGDIEVTDFQGNTLPSKAFAQQTYRVYSTPVTIFFNTEGRQLYRFSGVPRDVEAFMWLGEYVVEGQYRKQSFREFQRQKRQSNQ